MTMAYVRKTRDEWQLWANYGDGWDYVLSEEKYKNIMARAREYRANTKAELRIEKHRVPINK